MDQEACGMGAVRDVGERWVWLPGWMVSTSLLASQLSFDLVCKLPQVGDGLAQIGKLSVNGAGVCGGREGDHHAELLERRFHGFSFAKMTLTPAPAVEGIIPSSFLLYSCGQGNCTTVGVARGCAFFIGEGGSRYAHCLLARRRLCLLLSQLQKPLSASPRQLPRRQPLLLTHLEGRRCSLLPFSRGALLAARGDVLVCVCVHKKLPLCTCSRYGCRPGLGTAADHILQDVLRTEIVFEKREHRRSYAA